jgi:hypothetical protein
MSETPASVHGMAAPAKSTRVLVIPTDDTKAYLQVLDRPVGATSDLEALTALVGGWIESIGFNEESVVYLNEEGKLEGLAVNDTANRLQRLADYSLMPGDFLVGQVVLIGILDAAGDHDGESHDVPQSVLDACQRAGIEVVDRTTNPQ